MAISNTAPQLFLNRQQTFTSSGTFVHPDGYATPRLVRVQAWGGGGGGASGSATLYPWGITATASNFWYACGGGGGNSGYYRDVTFYVSANSTVVVGAGGTGGAAVVQTTAAGGQTAGLNGTRGGASTFGGWLNADGGGFGYNYGASNTGTTRYSYTGATSDGGSMGGLSWSSPSAVTSENNTTYALHGSNFGNGNVAYNNQNQAFGNSGQAGTWQGSGNGVTSVVNNDQAWLFNYISNIGWYWTTQGHPRFKQRQGDALSPYIAPGGQAGGGCNIQTSSATAIGGNGNFNPQAIDIYQTGMVGTAGTGGTFGYALNGTVSATAGGAGVGYSAGGGGGGGALSYQTGAFTVTSGAGGAGAPGLVIVSY